MFFSGTLFPSGQFRLDEGAVAAAGPVSPVIIHSTLLGPARGWDAS